MKFYNNLKYDVVVSVFHNNDDTFIGVLNMPDWRQVINALSSATYHPDADANQVYRASIALQRSSDMENIKHDTQELDGLCDKGQWIKIESNDDGLSQSGAFKLIAGADT